MDQLYGPFKSATYARGEKVVQTKLKSRGMARRNGEHQQAAALSLDFIDLATIVNGSPDDPIKDRPFDCHLLLENEDPQFVGKDWVCPIHSQLP